jgi:hypothetical protein
MRLARLAGGVVLAGIAAFAAWFGSMIIAKVFDDYKDSPDAVYIGVGGTALAMSALIAAAALLALAPGRHPRGWLGVALISAVASAFPYAAALGSTAYAVNVALALLAVGSALTYARA